MKKIRWMCGLVLVLGMSWRAYGDVLIESETKSGGFAGMGASEISSSSRIKGMMKRDDSSFKFTGGLMGKLAGGPQQSTTITRLDKDVVWSLDSKDKKYTERSISEIKEKGMPGQRPEAKKSKPTSRVVRSEVSVKKTGAKKTINGFPCEEYVMTWLVETEDLKTKARSTNTMITHLWNTPETPEIKKAVAEESAYSREYLKKLGMEASEEDMQKFGFGAFLGLGGAEDKDSVRNMEQLRAEMAKAKGYPIVTDTKWEVAGEKKAAPAREPEAKPEAKEEEGGSADVSGGPAGMFGSMMKKAMSEKPKEQGGEKTQKGGEEAPAFSSYTEIKSIKVVGLPGSEFEIPAGYAKK